MKKQIRLMSRLGGCALIGLGLGVAMTQPAGAGTFVSNFNSGVPPAGMNVYGSAQSYDHSTGGVGNTGVLKLTLNTASQQSSAIIDDFDNYETIGGFEATFQLFIGGGNGADGMSFVYGDFADITWGEEGPAIHGLTVTFDEYNSGGTPPEAPAIDVKWDGVTVFHRLVGATGATTPASPIGTATTIRNQTTANGAPVYWPVKIRVETDGRLSLSYNNVLIVTNLPIFRPLTDPPIYGPGYRFAFGARTGGSADNHWVDDLSITTFPLAGNSGQPALASIDPVPVGANAGAAGGVRVVFTNLTSSVLTNTINMTYNGSKVTPQIAETEGAASVSYRPASGALPTGAGTVVVGYATTSGFTNFYSYNFVVDPFVTIPTNYSVASVDTSKPGFRERLKQMDFILLPGDNRGRVVQAERSLANGITDTSTGMPYPNTADMSAADAAGYFSIPDVLNFNYLAPSAAGNFSVNSTPLMYEDKPFPGIPGMSFTPTDNFVAEFTAFLQLKAGGHRFGVNSDDGFKVSFGPGFDVPSSQIVGIYDGTRGAGNTLFDVVIPQDGFYPVRIFYVQATGGSSLEFFWIDPDTGASVLVNDPDNLKAPRAYQSSTVSRPSITRVLPTQNFVGVFPDDDLVIDITDGALPLASAVVTINNSTQAVTSAKSGKVTTFTRKGSMSNLLPSGLNTVRVIYSYTGAGAETFTNTYSYTVAPYYGVLPAGNRVASASNPGIRGRVHQIDRSGDANQGNGSRISGGGDANRMPWPEVQLINGNINPTNGLPYPNLAAKSPNNDYVFEFDVVNWNMGANAVVANAGVFQSAQPPIDVPGARADVALPGLPGTGTSYSGLENYINEMQTYLELKRGVYVFAFNSDDGFVVRSAPNPNDTLGTLVGFYNGGRGQSANPTGTAPVGQNPPILAPWTSSGSSLFSVIVPEDGIYPFRILYWQGGTGINAEFYSLNRDNGMTLLVGDTGADPSAITAYTTYDGPARPYVKFSISPNPWDNAVQQVGPGPITMVGRTRAAANSSDIYNFVNTTYVIRPWADVAIGGVIGNGVNDNGLALLLDGVVVPATLTTNGSDVTVAYKPAAPLPSGSTHTAGLVYAGTTNSWSFTVQTYTNLSAGDALSLSAANPEKRGFRVKMAQTASIAPFTQNTLARAEAQITGVLGPNVALPGPGPDGAFIYTNIINWTNNNPANTPQGNFQVNTYGAATGWPHPFYADEPMPGVPGTGLANTDNSAAEVFAYLAFPAPGYYKLGVNSDDGFGVKIGTPGVTNGMVITALDVGKGASDVPFSFIVPEAGLYPVRLVYYNGGSGGNLEYFSYDAAGNKIPINDRNNEASIKAYYELASVVKPVITSAVQSNGQIIILWSNGGTLESAPSLSGPWASTGDSDGSYTEPALGTMKFYRVRQ